MASKKGVKAKLNKAKAAWAGAEPQEGGFLLADGTFNAKIENATIETSQNDRLQIVYELKFLSGENSGRTARKFAGLDSEDNCAWAKGDLVRLGIDPPEDIDELAEALGDCVGMYVECTVKTKDEFQNIYFNEVIEGVDEEDEELDFASMSKKELIVLATEYGIKVPKKLKKDEDELREFVEEAYNELPEEDDDEDEEGDDEDEDDDDDSSDDEDEEDEDDEDEDEDGDEDVEEVDLDAMDKEELVQLVREEKPKGLTVKTAKSMTVKKLRTKLETLLS